MTTGTVRTASRASRRVPATVGYLAVLIATGIVQLAVSDTRRRALLTGSSSDVAHLGRDAFLAVVASAFWLPDLLSVIALPAIIAVLVVGERRFGTPRVVVLFVTGHVVATLLTELPVALAIHVGWLSSAHAHILDVGPSYGTYAVAGALAVAATSGRHRAWYLGGLTLAVSIPLVIDAEVTTVGHAIAVVAGVVAGHRLVTRRWWPQLWPRARRPRLGPPWSARSPR